MALKLTEGEIKKRLIRLRNLEQLHLAQLKRNERLLEDNRKLTERVASLEARDREKDTLIAELKLQLEELKRMIFGRRGKKQQWLEDEDDDTTEEPRPRVPRTPDSYHRTLPKDKNVTHTEHHGIDACPDCSTPLEKIETRTFYEEDIVLPDTATVPLKTVAKHEVERGWCRQCRAWRKAIPLPSAAVVLGKRVRLYICYLAILIRLSFSQVRTLLTTTYNFQVSEGEIASILGKEARTLRPEYEALKDRIRQQKGVHYDETVYKVVKEAQGNYAWVMTGTETNDAVFACGRSRGKGVAEELRSIADHVGITDGYGAYKNMFTRHALCWAHPHRKLRDLAGSEALSLESRAHCKDVFRSFAALYAEVEHARQRSFDALEREEAAIRLGVTFDAVTAVHPSDMPQLARIKTHLREEKRHYFTCILENGIPADNNKAERALRHLVIKRKTSFGSKTKRGAEAVSILTSVILSLWWRKPTHFFTELLALRGV